MTGFARAMERPVVFPVAVNSSHDGDRFLVDYAHRQIRYQERALGLCNGRIFLTGRGK